MHLLDLLVLRVSSSLAHRLFSHKSEFTAFFFIRIIYSSNCHLHSPGFRWSRHKPVPPVMLPLRHGLLLVLLDVIILNKSIIGFIGASKTWHILFISILRHLFNYSKYYWLLWNWLLASSTKNLYVELKYFIVINWVTSYQVLNKPLHLLRLLVREEVF